METGNRRERKRQVFCLAAALIAAAVITGFLVWQRGMLVEARSREAQEELAETVLRFHVLADSDSDRDQKLKMAVKEVLLSYMKKNMPETDDLEETIEWMGSHLSDMEKTGEMVLRNEGCTDEVSAEVVKDYFRKKLWRCDISGGRIYSSQGKDRKRAGA